MGINIDDRDQSAAISSDYNVRVDLKLAYASTQVDIDWLILFKVKDWSKQINAFVARPARELSA